MLCKKCGLEAGKSHDKTCGCNSCPDCGNTFCVSRGIFNFIQKDMNMGWKQYCPKCKQERETSCCACGCGNCLTCDYRFFCASPLDFNNPKFTISTLFPAKVISEEESKILPHLYSETPELNIN